MKAIMYHYVREFDSNLPFFRFLHKDSFASQLDWLSENFGMASNDDWSAATAGQFINDDKVVLTFDDGLKDHIKYVFPQLKSRGMWGIFYICSGPYISGRALDVHKVHLLLGRLGENAFAVLKKIVQPEMLSDEGREAFDKGAYATQSNSKPVEQFKRYLNYYIIYEYREIVLDKLMQDIFDCKEKDLVKELYLSIEDIRDLSRLGMIVGSHTVTHRVLSRLSKNEQRDEIFNSQEFFESVLGVIPTTFCYPYGGDHSFTGDTQNLLDEAGIEFAFSVEPRDCSLNDFTNLRLKLPRYDCNMYPYGQLHIESNT